MPELAAQRFAEIAQKWRDLIDSRCAQFIMLQRSGGWRHFYSEAKFLDLMREALGFAEMWRALAPRPEDEVAPPPEPSASPARAQRRPRSHAGRVALTTGGGGKGGAVGEPDPSKARKLDGGMT